MENLWFHRWYWTLWGPTLVHLWRVFVTVAKEVDHKNGGCTGIDVRQPVTLARTDNGCYYMRNNAPCPAVCYLGPLVPLLTFRLNNT